MAAAALGHAARRLGGGALRQTQEAAISRLSPRFVHTEHACSCGKAEKESMLRRIMEKKEDLYNTLSEADTKYGADPDMECRRNGQLFEYLAGHIETRPNDPRWRSNMYSQIGDGCIKLLGNGVFYGGFSYVIGNTLVWLISD